MKHGNCYTIMSALLAVGERIFLVGSLLLYGTITLSAANHYDELDRRCAFLDWVKTLTGSSPPFADSTGECSYYTKRPVFRWRLIPSWRGGIPLGSLVTCDRPRS